MVLSGNKSETRGSKRNSHIFARRVIVIEKIGFMTTCFVSSHGPGDPCFSTFYNDPFLAGSRAAFFESFTNLRRFY